MTLASAALPPLRCLMAAISGKRSKAFWMRASCSCATRSLSACALRAAAAAAFRSGGGWWYLELAGQHRDGLEHIADASSSGPLGQPAAGHSARADRQNSSNQAGKHQLEGGVSLSH